MDISPRCFALKNETKSVATPCAMTINSLQELLNAIIMERHCISLTYGSLPTSITADTCSRSFNTLAVSCGEVVVPVVVAAILSVVLVCLYFCWASTFGNNISYIFCIGRTGTRVREVS